MKILIELTKESSQGYANAKEMLDEMKMCLEEELLLDVVKIEEVKEEEK